MGIWIGIGIVIILLLLVVINAKKKTITIAKPELGLLNFIGPSAQKMLSEDRDAIRWVFYSVTESESETPRCDVLLIYVTANPDGSLEGSEQSLRQIIFDSGAKIVVVANENLPEHYSAALKQPGEGQANIVLTIDRRGPIFPSFFNRLFEIMTKGIIMPVAWVRLAPQRPGDHHPDCPGTIFLCEAGGVTFNRLG
jgi:hypothetical protein